MYHISLQWQPHQFGSLKE